jgi:hypothetical protein
MRCGYCAGQRASCLCDADCGARPGALSGHWCPQADGYVAWLEGTGLYGADEIARMRARGLR